MTTASLHYMITFTLCIVLPYAGLRPINLKYKDSETNQHKRHGSLLRLEGPSNIGPEQIQLTYH